VRSSAPWHSGRRRRPRGDVTIRGRVTESVTGGPLESANIFLAGTTIGTVTDRGGDFALRGIRQGPISLSCPASGTGPGISSVEIASTDLAAMSIVLERRDLVTEEITVEAGDPKNGGGVLSGSSPRSSARGPNAALCTIVNLR